ncbi:MAG: OmpA family protein [Pseudomonadota bacterium]
MIRIFPKLALTSGLALLAACNQPVREPSDDVSPEPTPEVEATAPVSILRPEVSQPEMSEPELKPLQATIGFPEGGSELDADAVAALEQALAAPAMQSGLPITLGAHSDSAGTDTANADAAEARGLAVAKWLIDQGINEDRITVIVFGEQNPAQPNALPDGSPNESGRAANRRVEIEVAAMSLTVSTTEDTDAEAPASDTSAEAGD